MEGVGVTALFGEAFSGRSVFVTGHTGFKGSWLSLWLHRLGARVTGYSLPPPTEPNLFSAARVGELLVRHVDGDIRDEDRLAAAVKEAAPEVLIHLAAQPLVRESYRIPRETFDVNVIGTGSVLEAVRRYGRPCVVVIITSDKCYENQEREDGYSESDPMGGYDPYSASKGAAELLVSSYRRSFFSAAHVPEPGVLVTTARAGNVIGGGDWAADRIVTDIVRMLAAGEPISLRNPDAIRPWQHVLEPLGGYLTLAARLLRTGDRDLCCAWNFGPLARDELRVCDLVERFLHYWGAGSWRDVRRPDQQHEGKILRLKIDKAVSELGWRPRWDIDTAIEKTVAWYRQFYQGGSDMRSLAVRQIAEYESLED